MIDLDPRDYDSRDEERHANTPNRGGRGGSGNHDRDHDWSQPGTRTRGRDNDDAPSQGVFAIAVVNELALWSARQVNMSAEPDHTTDGLVTPTY
jgi:hypothetical protein